MELDDRLKGPLTLEEMRRLRDFAVQYANEHPGDDGVAIGMLILKAGGQQVQAMKEFSDGYQVRGELHELTDNAARLIHERLNQVELLPLCERCKILVNEALM